MRYAKWFWGVILAFVAIVLLANSLLVEQPQRKLQRLMGGDTGVEIASFRVSGQGQMIELDDEESLRYLAMAFRAATKDGFVSQRGGGIVYGAHLRFGFLQQTNFHIYSGQQEVNGVTISLAEPGITDPTYYWLPFPDPVPAPVAEMLRQMRK